MVTSGLWLPNILLLPILSHTEHTYTFSLIFNHSSKCSQFRLAHLDPQGMADFHQFCKISRSHSKPEALLHLNPYVLILQIVTS